MEQWEQQLIRQNMKYLIELTIPNTVMLSVLEAKNILGRSDIDALNSQVDPRNY